MTNKCGPPRFEDLKTSTKTIMCYTNVQFDLRKVFEMLDINEATHIAPQVRRHKHKHIDKKKMRAQRGSIVSMHYQKYLRGINLRKMKKYWCPRCKLLNVKGKPVKTVEAVFVSKPVEGFTRAEYSTLEWYCEKCDQSYAPQTVGRKKIDNFLNQTTLILFLREDHYINIMLFKNSLKIAGCKCNEDAISAVDMLWRRLKPDAWSLSCETRPFFVFEVVMRNVGFNLGFGINRTLLNLLMNETQFADKVALSQFEPTGQTNVNIKMYSSKPKNFMYDCLVYPLPSSVSRASHLSPLCPCSAIDDNQSNFSEPFLIEVDTLFFKKAKDKPEKPMTFIVFSSSQTILSGKYDANVKEQYQFFIDTLLKYKDRIQERLEEDPKDCGAGQSGTNTKISRMTSFF